MKKKLFFVLCALQSGMYHRAYAAEEALSALTSAATTVVTDPLVLSLLASGYGVNRYLKRFAWIEANRSKELCAVGQGEIDLVMPRDTAELLSPDMQSQIRAILKRCEVEGTVRVCQDDELPMPGVSLSYSEGGEGYELALNARTLLLLGKDSQDQEPQLVSIRGRLVPIKTQTILNQSYCLAGMARRQDPQALAALKQKTASVKAMGDRLVTVGFLGSLFKYRGSLSSSKVSVLASGALVSFGITESWEKRVIARAGLDALRLGDAFALTAIKEAGDLTNDQKIAALKALEDYWWQTGEDLGEGSESDMRSRGIGYSDAIRALEEA